VGREVLRRKVKADLSRISQEGWLYIPALFFLENINQFKTMKTIITTLLFCSTVLSVTAQNYVIFHAFPADWSSDPNLKSYAGHTYVTILKKDYNRKQTVFDIFGFYPTQGGIKAVFGTDGEIRNDLKQILRSQTVDFITEIDEDTYKKIKQLRSDWDNNKYYSAIGNQTCVTFVRDIAAKIDNLVVPSGSGVNVFPKPFLYSLRESNTAIDTKARNSLYSYLEVNPFTEITKEQLKPVKSNASINANLIGGATPEALGKILLNALKTNDNKSWARTVLTLEPTPNLIFTQNDYIEYAEWHKTKRFQLLREGLAGQGVTDWNSVVFSRVVYESSPFDNDTGAGRPVIEFTYKEFVGSFNFAYFTFKDGKFYVASTKPSIMSRGELRRNPR
jgi:hypothetical protein